jgi:uncharacterized protein YcbK (DUF882 family)
LRVKIGGIFLWVFLLLAPAFSSPRTAGAAGARYFYSGDGKINLATDKSSHVFSGRYRRRNGQYDTAALKAIYRVFGAPYDRQHLDLSLRLIEFLDYLQDHFRPGARITITSGYRNPTYNRALRRRGALAAKASLHQYGMAADLRMEGIAPKRIWKFVKTLGFGGTGYYHGATVHVDVGPARFWDEKTSGVGTGISDDNKLIGLVTDYDIYSPGEDLRLRFIRMTAFPIGIRQTFVLLRRSGDTAFQPVASFSPAFNAPHPGPCPRFGDIEQMADIDWTLPQDLPPGSYQVQAAFCGDSWKGMPVRVVTPEFRVTPMLQK